MEGKMDELKGRAKEAAGDLDRQRPLKREGKADKAEGKVKQTIDDVKDKAEDVVDKVRTSSTASSTTRSRSIVARLPSGDGSRDACPVYVAGEMVEEQAVEAVGGVLRDPVVDSVEHLEAVRPATSGSPSPRRRPGPVPGRRCSRRTSSAC